VKINSKRIITTVFSIWIGYFLILFFGTNNSTSSELFYKGQIDKSTAIESSQLVTQEKYPDADYVNVNQHYWAEYSEDGTYTQWDEQYIKILSDDGKDLFSSIKSNFSTNYNSTKIIFAEIIKPDGTVLKVDIDDNSKIAIDAEQMDENIFDPNQKYIQANIADLEVGDLLHFLIFDKFFKPYVPNTWSGYIPFEDTNPIICKQVTIVAPKNLPLAKIKTKNEIQGTLSYTYEENEDSIIYNWIATNVPMAFLENNMPPFHSQIQHVLVSTVDKWESISRWYWNLSEAPLNEINQQIVETVSQITDRANTKDEKINAIFTWVSQEIRYLGLTTEKEAPGYEPHPVSMTFERRAGVCRDKAALLASMLRLGGFEAYPVLIRTDSKMDTEVPIPYFDHAVTAIREDNGSYILLDSTNETSKQLFPAYLNDKSYLVAKPEGEVLLNSPTEPADDNMVKIITIANIDDRGNLVGESTITFEGINDTIYREYLIELSQSKRLNYFAGVINSHSFNSEIKNLRISPDDLLNTDKPLTVSFTFMTSDIFYIGKSLSMMKPPFIGKMIGLIHFMADDFKLDKRRYPFVIDNTCGIQEDFEIAMPDHLLSSTMLPKFSPLNSENVIWERFVTKQDGKLVGKSTFKLMSLEYSPEDYFKIKNTYANAENDRKRMVLFKESTHQEESRDWYSAKSSDALVIEESEEYVLENTHNWTENYYSKVKILSYSGKKRYSDIAIPYNPIWETIEIKNARVINKSGESIYINNNEINIMDADWVGDAPNYLPEKVMVINFPGVDIGSIIELSILRTKRDQPFFSIDSSLFDYENPFILNNGRFRYYDPIEKKKLIIKYPEKLNLIIQKFDAGTLGYYNTTNTIATPIIRQDTSHSDGVIVYEFSAENIAPVQNEKNSPPWYTFNPTIFVSSTTLDRFSEDLRDKLNNKINDSSYIKSLIKKIIKSENDVIGQIEAIRDYVDEHINYIHRRYNEIPATDINNADEVLNNAYGHTVDNAILLYTMLKAAKLNPEFVLSTDIVKQPNLWKPLSITPSPNWYDLLLVRVKTEKGYIYLNDTNRYSKVGTTYSHGFPGLNILTGRMETIMALSEEYEDKTIVQYDIKVNPDLSAQLVVHKEYYGTDYNDFRESIEDLSPEFRRRHLLSLTTEISQDAIPNGEYITNFDQYPATENYSVLLKNYALSQGDYCYLEFPGLTDGISGVNLNERSTPFYYSNFNDDIVRINITFPESKKTVLLALPEYRNIHFNGLGQIIIKSDANPMNSSSLGQKINCDYSLEQRCDLSPYVILPDQYLDLRSKHNILAHPSMKTILFN
jgi:hypothetical protein